MAVFFDEPPPLPTPRGGRDLFRKSALDMLILNAVDRKSNRTEKQSLWNTLENLGLSR